MFENGPIQSLGRFELPELTVEGVYTGNRKHYVSDAGLQILHAISQAGIVLPRADRIISLHLRYAGHQPFLGWHQDSFGSNQKVIMAMWANVQPTEYIIDNSGAIYTPAPCELVLVHNLSVHHRGPQHVVPNRRFMRLMWFEDEVMP